MKKILLLICLCLTGCNYKAFDTAYDFKKVHLFTTNRCFNIESWTDFQDSEQIQVEIKNYGYILVSSYSCMLIEDTCPICDYVPKKDS